MDWYWPETVDLPGYKPNTKGHPKQIKDAARLIGEAQRPVIYAGGGILKARAAEALRELAELTGIPGRHHADGARRVPRRPRAVPRHAGHARQLHRGHRDAEGRPAHRARARASTTASPASSTAFAPDAKIIHVDIDPAELGKVRRPDVPIVGDCRLVIEELIKAVKAEQSKREWPDARRVARRSCASGRSSYPLHYEQLEDGPLKPQFVHRAAARQHARRHDRRRRAWASTRCGRASAGSSTTRTRG